MTIDQVVALLSSLGTVLAAVATLLTVQQMAKQRKASYRPELMVSRRSWVSHKSNDNDWRFDQYSEETDNRSSKGERDFIPDVVVTNIGLASAKNVEIVWDFDFSEVIDQINKSAQEALLPLYLKFERNLLSIDAKGSSAMSNWPAQQTERLDYVLAENENMAKTYIEIPNAYASVVACALFVFVKVSQGKRVSSSGGEGGLSFQKLPVFPTIPDLMVSLKYEDVAGDKHRNDFAIKFQPVMVSNDSVTAYIEPRRVTGVHQGLKLKR